MCPTARADETRPLSSYSTRSVNVVSPSALLTPDLGTESVRAPRKTGPDLTESTSGICSPGLRPRTGQKVTNLSQPNHHGESNVDHAAYSGTTTHSPRAPPKGRCHGHWYSVVTVLPVPPPETRCGQPPPSGRRCGCLTPPTGQGRGALVPRNLLW